MTSLEVRGSKQWAAAVGRAEDVEELDVHGPRSLALEGIERMVNLRRVWFVDDAPTDQLYRLRALRSLDWVWVDLGRKPHDLASLLGCRIVTLEVQAFNVRRGLELAELPFHRVEALTGLRLDVQAPAMVPWDCTWLPGAAGLQGLTVTGLYAWPDAAWTALRSARQLRSLTCHPNRGGDYRTEVQAQRGELFTEWTAEMEAALPETAVHPSRWLPGLPDVDRRWDVAEVAGREAVGITVGLDELAGLAVEVGAGEQLRAVLARWNPMLERRVSIEAVGDAIRIEAPTSDDIAFIQELLTFGTPDDPDPAAGPPPTTPAFDLEVGSREDNAAVEQFVTAFLAEVDDGRLADDKAAAERWARGMRDLQAAGIETLEDTTVREQLHEVLEQPLADAGLDAEYVVLAF
jgi:hypothetical protein